MEFKQCEYIYSRGKNKGLQCVNRTKRGLCYRHKEVMRKREKAMKKKELNEDNPKIKL